MGERADREVAALGEMPRRDGRRIETADARRDLPSVEAGGVDDETGLDLGRVLSAGAENHASTGDLSLDERRAQRHRRTGCLGIALIGQH